jgi:hypothetical protein
MRHALDYCSLRDIPRMSRPNFAAELRHTFLWGLFTGLVEGNTSSIVVAKTFHGSPLLITIVWATPMLANVLSLLWGVLIWGRPRKPVFISTAIVAAVSFGSVALVSSDWFPWGGWVFALQVALARIFLAGLINVRTSIWKTNYPADRRASITARLQSLRTMMGLLVSAGAGLLFNLDPDHYRWVYPVISLIGALSLLPLRSLRIRGQALELARFRRHAATASPAGDASPSLRAGLVEALSILRRDRAFARYCTAQFFLGSSNFMVDPVILLIVTQRLGFDYFTAAALLDLVPNIVMLLTIPAWSRLFDRRGVLHFRVINTLFWLLSTIAATGGLIALSAGVGGTFVAACLVLLMLSRIANGIGRGGGSIAWNLGHLHFASEHDETLYMGVHVALTGVRGMTMPFVAVLLYHYADWLALLVATAVCSVALVMFRRLAHEADHAERSRAERAAQITGVPPDGEAS